MSKIIVIGGSAGSFRIVSKILASIPAKYPFPIVVCMHRLRNIRSCFVETLSINSNFRIKEVFDKEKIQASTAYIAPANYHLYINFGKSFSLSVEPPVNHSRPSIDMTMETAAEVYLDEVVGVLLSGANNDGARGMKKIHENGGATLVQDPDTCEISTMPKSCLQLFTPTYVLDVETIIEIILNLDV